MKNLTRISAALKICSMVCLAALPLSEAGYWITDGYPFLQGTGFAVDPLPQFGSHPLQWGDLTEVQKLLGFASNLLPLVFSMAALYCLFQVFSAFERLELFAKSNATLLKKAGWSLVLGQLVFPLHTVLLSLSLTYRNPVGTRNITVAFGSHQAAILLIGMAVLLVAGIMEQAASLHEEQQGTV